MRPLAVPAPRIEHLPPRYTLSPGNLQLSITNIHVRYEDDVTNPGHPFSCGITLDKLAAATVDDKGEEAFVTTTPLSLLRKVRCPGCVAGLLAHGGRSSDAGDARSCSRCCPGTQCLVSHLGRRRFTRYIRSAAGRHARRPWT